MKKRPSISPNKVRCAVAASWNVVGQNLFYLRTKSDLQSTTSNLPFLLLYCDQEISNILCPICQHGGRGVHDVLASLLRICHVVHLYIQSVNINQ